jgi:tRNA A37 threonylcarbamoyladenosine dehydratase
MDELNWLSRTELLIGKEALGKLKRSHVLVVGLGGVGSIAAEMICRAGIGKMTIVDGDVYNITNRNRQTGALKSTEGRMKTEVIAEKLMDINSKLHLNIKNSYHTGEDMPALLEAGYDFVVDAIDTLTPKVYLLYHCVKKGLKVVSSMGSGGKTKPETISMVDISKTNHCDFAYDIRKRLHKLDVYTGITAIYSPEPVSKESKKTVSDELNKKSIIGTISYMPAIFGCYCAYVVIRDLAGF